jgi:hypothetical protein
MVDIESNKQRLDRGMVGHTVSVFVMDTWKGMGEITPGRYEHATCRRRETRVADDLEERQ